MMLFLRHWILGIALLMMPASLFAFGDITADDPQAHVFTHLRDVGVMSTFGDGSFHPEKVVTRAEALTIALRAGGIAIPAEFSGETFFTDVDPNQWYAAIVARAVEVKVVSTRNTNFRPNQAVTKAEFLAFLFRATQVDFRPYFGRTHGIAFDVPADSWFAPHFAYAKKYQIAHLPFDKFYRPLKILSRREVAMMTYRQLHLFHGDGMTKVFVELQAEIQQFIGLLQSGKADEAEFHLQKILKLNHRLTRMRNNTEAVAARAISRAMTHLAESLRYFRHGRTLAALENLHLASKQTQLAAEKSTKFSGFVEELARLIDETMKNFLQPKGGIMSNG